MLPTQKRSESIICSYLKKAFDSGYDVKGLQAIQEGMLHQLFYLHHAIYTDAEGEMMIRTLTDGNLKRHAKMLIGSLPIIGELIWKCSLASVAVASTYALAQVAVLRLIAQCSFAKLHVRAVKTVYRQEFEQGKAVAATLEKQHGHHALISIDFEAAQELYRRISEEMHVKQHAAEV